MNKVNKSIGWADYSINPVKGKCPMGCSYCYARRMYNRFKWNPEMRLDLSVFNALDSVKKPSRIFVGSTFELFHATVPWEWQFEIMYQCKSCATYANHAFLFLTKCPQNLIHWNPFPENCWVGVTATNQQAFLKAIQVFIHHRIKAKVRYISFEPLLKEIPMTPEQLKAACDWLIIGAQTKPYKPPEIEWVQEIVEAADKVGIPVFLKDNLKPLNLPLDSLYYNQHETQDGPEYQLRQEFPKCQ